MPASLVVLVAGIAISILLDLADHGVAIVGEIPSSAAFLTPLFTDLPDPVLGAIVIVAVRGFLRTEPLGRDPVPGLLTVRPDGPVVLANANPIRQGVLGLVAAAAPPPRVVLLDLSSSFRLSLPTVDTLTELDDALSQRGVELWLTRLREPAATELRASGAADRFAGRRHDTLEDAARAYGADAPRPDGEG